MTDQVRETKVKIVKERSHAEIIASEGYKSVKLMLIKRVANHIKHADAGYGEVDPADYTAEEKADSSILEVIQVYAGNKLFGVYTSRKVENKFTFNYVPTYYKKVDAVETIKKVEVDHAG